MPTEEEVEESAPKRTVTTNICTRCAKQRSAQLILSCDFPTNIGPDDPNFGCSYCTTHSGACYQSPPEVASEQAVVVEAIRKYRETKQEVDKEAVRKAADAYLAALRKTYPRETGVLHSHRGSDTYDYSGPTIGDPRPPPRKRGPQDPPSSAKACAPAKRHRGGAPAPALTPNGSASVFAGPLYSFSVLPDGGLPETALHDSFGVFHYTTNSPEHVDGATGRYPVTLKNIQAPKSLLITRHDIRRQLVAVDAVQSHVHDSDTDAGCTSENVAQSEPECVVASVSVEVGAHSNDAGNTQHATNAASPTIITSIEPSYDPLPQRIAVITVESPEVQGFMRFMRRDHTRLLPSKSEIQKSMDSINYAIVNAASAVYEGRNISETEPAYARLVFSEVEKNPQLLNLYKTVYTSSISSDRNSEAWVERAQDLEIRRLAAHNLLRALIAAFIMQSVLSIPRDAVRNSPLSSHLEYTFEQQGLKDYFHMAQRQAHAQYLESECKVETDNKLAKKLCRELIETLMPIILDNMPDRQDVSFWKSFKYHLHEALKRAVKLRSRMELGDRTYKVHWFGGEELFDPNWMDGVRGGGGAWRGYVVDMCVLPAVSMVNPDAEGGCAVLSMARVLQRRP